MDKRNPCFVPLDLVMDYPVNWEFWRVLRDLIRTFTTVSDTKIFIKNLITAIPLIKQVTSLLP